MGRYIQTDSDFGKADAIINQYGAKEIPQPKDFSEVPADKALVCVVENPHFDAAAYAYSAAEFKVFTDPTDWRRKRWLLLDLDV